MRGSSHALSDLIVRGDRYTRWSISIHLPFCHHHHHDHYHLPHPLTLRPAILGLQAELRARTQGSQLWPVSSHTTNRNPLHARIFPCLRRITPPDGSARPEALGKISQQAARRAGKKAGSTRPYRIDVVIQQDSQSSLNSQGCQKSVILFFKKGPVLPPQFFRKATRD